MGVSDVDRFDLVVIGAGPAGEKGAAQAAYFGKRVAIVERAEEPGGAAVHTGTLPSKTLRETALFLSGHRQRELYGLKVEVDPSHAVPKLLSRKDAVRELEVARIRWNLERARRHADPRRGALRRRAHRRGDRARRRAAALTFEFVLVATGSTPFRPPNIPFDDPDVDDSDTILLIDRLPETHGRARRRRHRLRVRVHVRGAGREGARSSRARPRLPFLDLEMGERLRASMIALGIDVGLDDAAKTVRREAGPRHRRASSRTARAIACEQAARRLRAAPGAPPTWASRRSASSPTSAATCRSTRTTAQRRRAIYAAGDVIGFPALASTSMEQARVAVCHAFGFALQARGRRAPAVRRLHDPRGELRGPLRGAGRARRRSRTSWSAARSTATTRAARSSATRTAW